jgi:hypothetical protein
MASAIEKGRRAHPVTSGRVQATVCGKRRKQIVAMTVSTQSATANGASVSRLRRKRSSAGVMVR